MYFTVGQDLWQNTEQNWLNHAEHACQNMCPACKEGGAAAGCWCTLKVILEQHIISSYPISVLYSMTIVTASWMDSYTSQQRVFQAGLKRSRVTSTCSMGQDTTGLAPRGVWGHKSLGKLLEVVLEGFFKIRHNFNRQFPCLISGHCATLNVQ